MGWWSDQCVWGFVGVCVCCMFVCVVCVCVLIVCFVFRFSFFSFGDLLLEVCCFGLVDGVFIRCLDLSMLFDLLLLFRFVDRVVRCVGFVFDVCIMCVFVSCFILLE